MANTIKLKRGSGSDPQASDLEIGELAIRTDSGKIFTKKDNGSVAEISGGGGIDDGDKGDITVSNGGDTFVIDSGVIDNANINASAAIAGTKISPNFGSQNVATTGTISSDNITISGAAPKLTFTDTDNNPDYEIRNLNGALEFKDGTSATNRLVINTDGHVDVTGNLDVGAGLDVTGNITGTGDLKINNINKSLQVGDITNDNYADLRQISASSYKGFSFQHSNASVLANLQGTTNQYLVLGDNDSNNSGTLFGISIDQGGSIVTRLTLSASGNLDVQNNITLGGTVDGRDLASDGSKLDGIESGATADQTASEILTLIKTVDGSGSGLDADTLDGVQGSSYLRSDAADTSSGTIAFGVGTLDPDSFASHSGGFGGISDGSGWGARGVFVHGGGTGDAAAMAHNGSKLYFGIQNGSSANSMETWLDVTPNTRVINFQTDDNANNVQIGGNKIFHAGNDGSGSGLDSDLLDGQEGSYYRNAGNINAGTLAAARLSTATTQSAGNNTTKIATTAFVSTAISNLINGAPAALDTLNELAAAMNDNASFSTTVTNSLATKMPLAGGEFTGNITFSGSQTVDGRDLSVDGSKLDGIESGATADQTASEILTLIKTVDGAGSGLNADLLDGVSSASFVRSDANDSITGLLTITNDSGLNIYTSTNAAGAKIKFSDQTGQSQNGTLTYKHSDGAITTTGGNSNDGWVFEGSETRTVVKVVGDIEATSNIYGAGGTFSGDVTFSGGASAITIAANSDIRFTNGTWTGDAVKIQQHANRLYVVGGSAGIRFRENGTDRWDIDPSGHFVPRTDSTYNIGSTSIKVANGYFDNLHGAGANITALNASNISSGTIAAARLPNHSAALLTSGTLLAARLGAASASEAGISVVGNFGQWQGHSTYTDFNTEPAYWGWNFIQGSTNAPNSTSSQWYRCRLSLGSGYGKGSDSNDYSLEMALPRYSHASSGGLHIRTIENGSEGSWTLVGSNASLISTGTLPAARIGSNAVTFARMQDIAEERLIGRVSSGSGDPEALTQAQVRTFLGLASSATTDTTNASNISSGTIPSARLSASDLLTKIKTVDGSGSGLDADLLDGYNQSDSAGNNTIVRRNANGYIFSNYINTTDNSVTSGVAEVMVKTTGGGDYHRSASAGAIRTFINVEDGATADQSASEILTLLKTVDGSGSGLDADTLDGISSASFLRSDQSDEFSGDLTIGNGTANTRLLIKKQDNNVSDHIQFYNGTTRVGEIGCQDTTWLRINQVTSKNIYTPRYIRADAGFFVDGTSKGINGSGNFIGGTIAGASDYSTLLRSNADDTASGIITLSSSARDCLNFSANSTDDNRGIAFNGRIALSADYNDGYLRLNQASEFSNGVYTPGVIRADSGFKVHSGSSVVTVINSSAQLIAAQLTGALPAIDGSALTGISAGAQGGGSDEVFWCNGQTVTANFTIPNGKNAMSAGPITINSGITVTVGSGETWTVV